MKENKNDSKLNIHLYKKVFYYRLIIIYLLLSIFSQVVCQYSRWQIRIKFNPNAIGDNYAVSSQFQGVPDFIYVNEVKRSTKNRIVKILTAEVNSDIYIVFTSKVTNLLNMFYNIHYIIEIDLSNFESSDVTITQSMFQDCQGLKSLNLKGFKTNKVLIFEKMFDTCISLKFLDLSGFETPLVQSFKSMFKYCKALTSLDLSGFVFKSTGLNMYNMFYGCEKLKYINIKNAPEYDYNGDIIGNTPNNLVMCFNKTIASSLFNILKNKGCANLDCSNNWKNNQNKIRDSNGDCVPSCIINTNYRLYDYENTCYENCPEETIKNDDYTCKSIYEIEENKTNENMQ